MMTWAFKRQIFYITILILFISFLLFLIIYPKLNKAPTCSDRKQNGTETGVDCGGACARACLIETKDLSVLWARSFRVIPGRFNAVAYIVNPNKNTAVQKINYRFRFADANNIYIGKREGSTLVPPGGNFAVFEPGIDIGNSIPVYTTFEFTEVPNWLQVSDEKLNQLQVFASDVELTNETTSPRLSANIKNNSLFIIKNLNVVAVLYDAKGNAISTSRTFVPELGSLQGTKVSFTWPEPIPGVVVVKEIIPIYDVFSVQLK